MDRIRLGSKEPLKVSPQDTVVSAARAMTERQVRSAAVLDGDKVIGVVTVNDVVKKVVAASRDPNITRVADIMSSPAQSIDRNTSVSSAADIMRKKRIRHLVVLDEHEKLVGMLSLPYVFYDLTDSLERNVGDLMGLLMIVGPGG